MIKHFICKKNVYILITLLLVSIATAQNFNVDYIGIVSNDIDQNMSKMTSDLYFTQLNEIEEITTFDLRTDTYLTSLPDKINLSKTHLSFYTEIKKSTETDKWITTIFVINPISNEEHSKTNEYDSFYKILMESKNTLKETISQLINNQVTSPVENVFNNLPKDTKITSTEFLSGTWQGEDFIDKIIILKGGRGFVIFNTGASMTVGIKLNDTDSGQKIIITQQGRANASYYPDLPRKIALDAALGAEPIVWTFDISDNNTLTGSKKTIIADSDTFAYDTISVKWNRMN